MADAEIELRYIADISEPERQLEELKRKAESTPIAVGGQVNPAGTPGGSAVVNLPGGGSISAQTAALNTSHTIASVSSGSNVLTPGQAASIFSGLGIKANAFGGGGPGQSISQMIAAAGGGASPVSGPPSAGAIASLLPSGQPTIGPVDAPDAAGPAWVPPSMTGAAPSQRGRGGIGYGTAAILAVWGVDRELQKSDAERRQEFAGTISDSTSGYYRSKAAQQDTPFSGIGGGITRFIADEFFGEGRRPTQNRERYELAASLTESRMRIGDTLTRSGAELTERIAYGEGGYRGERAARIAGIRSEGRAEQASLLNRVSELSQLQALNASTRNESDESRLAFSSRATEIEALVNRSQAIDQHIKYRVATDEEREQRRISAATEDVNTQAGTYRTIAAGGYAPLAQLQGRRGLAENALRRGLRTGDPLAQPTYDAAVAEIGAGEATVRRSNEARIEDADVDKNYYGRLSRGESTARAGLARLGNRVDADRRAAGNDPAADAIQAAGLAQLNYQTERVERNEFSTTVTNKSRLESLNLLNQPNKIFGERAQAASLNDIVRGTQQQAFQDFNDAGGANVKDIYAIGRARIVGQQQEFMSRFKADEAPSLNRAAVEDPGGAMKQFTDSLKKLEQVPDKMDKIRDDLKDAWKTQ